MPPVPRIPLLVVAVASAVAAACGGGGGGAVERGEATVVSVTDGDTIRVRLAGVEEKVRLIGIDTPETRGPGGLRECFGREASGRTKDLLPEGTPVRIERDVEARDRYDRLLAYVYRREDGLFVNLALARDGYAAVLTIPPNVAHAEEFRAAVADARQAGRGLWSACGGPDKELR